MNTKQRNVLVVLMVSTMASMLLSACETTTSKKDMDEPGINGSNQGHTESPRPPDQKPPRNKSNSTETRKSEEKDGANDSNGLTPPPPKTQPSDEVKSGVDQCEFVELGNNSFIDGVIKRLNEGWWAFSSKCEVVQTPQEWEQLYHITFSADTVIINRGGTLDLNKKELVTLDWKEINQAFVVVLNAATEMAAESMEDSSGTDNKLNIFKSSFPAGPVQMKEVPGTNKVSDDGKDYRGLSYTTIGGDKVYWTTRHQLKVAGRPTNLIVYQPAVLKQRPALGRFFNLN